ncbi:MAG: hypothetical protein KGL45_02620 [Gammaproteobacteria bacterium]|nr:hypothetical protein [Gammaproteobacteria bacterium]
MSDLERITGLINDIYDAALDASLWPQVLRRTMMLLDGVSAAILSIDLDPAFAESYVPHHMQPGDAAEERARATLRLLAPHLRRAMAIAKALERGESKSAALGEVLERLSAAVVFVDRAGRLVHANAPATRMLARNEVLTWADGRPRPVDERVAAHLRAILAAARRGRPAPDSCALAVADATPSGESLTIHVLPLSAGAQRQVLTPSAAAAAIIVSQQTWDLPQRLQSAAKLYALTPAESRVVSVLLAGCRIGSAAKALGITEATVKTHLQHVFDKTGTRRQVDLAQRIADCAGVSLNGAASPAAPAGVRRAPAAR